MEGAAEDEASEVLLHDTISLPVPAEAEKGWREKGEH